LHWEPLGFPWITVIGSLILSGAMLWGVVVIVGAL
jgi:hypothetical protein